MRRGWVSTTKALICAADASARLGRDNAALLILDGAGVQTRQQNDLLMIVDSSPPSR